MLYDFEWDSIKARKNISKHKVSFERATTIFRDPNLLSIPDEEHSQLEDRWITMGIDKKGILLVISHKFVSLDPEIAIIRIISARAATKTEIEHYEKGL